MLWTYAEAVVHGLGGRVVSYPGAAYVQHQGRVAPEDKDPESESIRAPPIVVGTLNLICEMQEELEGNYVS